MGAFFPSINYIGRERAETNKKVNYKRVLNPTAERSCNLGWGFRILSVEIKLSNKKLKMWVRTELERQTKGHL